MLEVSSVVPVKYKRRKVSAIRDFPKGCGILAVDVNLIPSKEPPPSVELECVKVTNSDEVPLEQVESVGCWKVPKEEAKVLNGSTVPLMPEAVESKDSRILGAGAKEEVQEGEGTKGLPEKIVKLEASELSKESLDRPELLDGSKIDGDVEKQVYSEKYIALKRRKVSAIRDFPVGCGRNAPKISKENHSEVAAVASSDGKTLDGKKKPAASSDSNTVDGEKKSVVSQHPMFEGSFGVESTEKAEAKVRKNDIEPTRERVKKINGEATVKSPKVKNLDGEKKSAVSQQPMVEGSVWVESTEKAEEEVRKKDAGPIRVQENNGGARVNSPKVKSLDGEKKPVAKQQAVMEGSVRVSSGEKVEGEVKRNDAKQIREKVREINGEARVKSPSWSGLKENTVEDLSEKKILVRYPSEKKLEGRDVKHVSKNLQVKGSRDARPQTGSKVVDKEGGNLIGKPVDKGSIKSPKDGKNLKRKFSEEVEDEGHVPDDQTRGNESLEAYGDRLIVQALMAAENCPWRKGKKSIATGSRSVMPKSKKEQKLLGSNFASKGFSTSQHKKKVDVEDEDDSVPQDDGSEKALTTYKSSRALSVTVTPSVPSRLNRKGASSEDAVTRNMVKKTLRLFQVVCRKLLQGEESRSKEYGKTQRVDLKAASILKENNEWVNYGTPILGDVPGVEVGDEFHYRVELSIIGLHRPFQGGIDYMKKDGNVLATSIVASGGYPDDMDSSDVLIYSGSGGNPVGGGDKQPGDQKLERGNLALKNSIDAKTPVRVIHGFKEKGSDSHDARAKIVSTFTYDGLYLVESYWQEKGPHGFSVFKFQMRRMPGQPELALKEVKKTKKSKVREGLCVKDISNGKESIPICAVNTIDDDRPMPFKYITKIIYPSWYVQKPPRGCDCTDGCSDSEKCACAVKNGGEIPFNFNGAIVQAKPLVFECGPSCKCPPSCHNRVSQHGIRIPLEIFKTKSRGWGVRSLYSIPSGTFICEYIGEMLQDTEAEQRSNDEYLFDIGHNYDDRSLWEGLPTLIPGLQSNAVCETVEDVGFTIDAAEYGTVGRFINHNCSPNLYAQNVLYDHDDKRMPHIMFFAADNIPPLQELTYHYNYMIDQVRDSEGHIKRKDCFCGSPECTGRLY